MYRWMLVALVVLRGAVGLGEGFVLPPGAVAAAEPGWAVDLAFSPHGRYLALALRERIEILSGTDLSPAGNVPAPEGKMFYSLAFVDGSRLVVGCADGSVILLDLSARTIIAESRPHRGRVWGIAVSPDGRYVASAAGDGTVALLSLPGLSEVFVTATHEGGTYSVAFSPDGGVLAAGGKGGTIELLGVPSGEPVGELRGHRATVWGLGTFPGGKLISAGSDGRVIVWDLPGGGPEEVLSPGAQRVREACTRPGGDLIALATSDVDVVLWSEAEESFIGRLHGHITPLWALGFSPDGKYLATASTGGRVILWDVERLLSLRPRIVKVHYSARMRRMQYIAVSFSDPNGDVSRVKIELLQGDPATIRVSSFSVGLQTRRSRIRGHQPLQPRALPAEFLVQGYRGREEGAFTFGLRVDEPQRLVLRIVLVDTLGLASEARLIEIVSS